MRSKNVSGGASVSRGGKNKVGRFGEKNLIILKKDMEKKIEKAIAKDSKNLSDAQTNIVAKMIRE